MLAQEQHIAISDDRVVLVVGSMVCRLAQVVQLMVCQEQVDADWNVRV